MYLKLILILSIHLSFAVYAENLNCKEEVLEFKNCKANSKVTESGLLKIFKIDSGDNSKKCALWTGYIEATCTNGKWEINNKTSKCKYECTCCY